MGRRPARRHRKTMLDRCSVFAVGFDLQSACAVAGFDDIDDYTVLDLLDALVRKSLLVADRSCGPDPIFDVGDDPPIRRGKTHRTCDADEVRTAHARYYAGRETDIMGLWDSRASGRRTTGSPPNWPICARRSAGLPTPTTSILRRPSPTMRHSSVSGANNTNPSGGPRNSSNPHALSNTGAWPSSTLWRRCASRPDASTPP